MKKINPFYFTIIMIAISIVGYFFITSFKKGGKNVKHHVNSFNYVIGTQTVGSKYKFTDKSMLVETKSSIFDGA